MELTGFCTKSFNYYYQFVKEDYIGIALILEILILDTLIFSKVDTGAR